ncbi:MAG: bifunctional protein-serine/threonine kinase/phosphatase [Aquabacterium sp.]|jgi:serine/threonine protein phosphatase PrpC|nr:MAG: bifunctional protein-serine/threonine kinase/phosphatase [Aquabacterium sp.]
MSFDVDIGLALARGPRERQEDCAAVRRTGIDEGLIAAIADGVSSSGAGGEAAQTAVLGVLEDFPATPATWDTTVALDRVVRAHNAWLADHNRRRTGLAGPDGKPLGAAMCTLTALALRGQGYTVAHVGDTRAWLLRERDGQVDCVQITADHRLDHPDLRNGLKRALGLDDEVRIDYLQGDLRIGDVFVLSSDGVHGSIRPRRLSELARQGTAQEAADALVKAALDAGSRDNCSAVVLRVRALASTRLEDAMRQGRLLDVPQRLRTGEALDGLVVEALVQDNGVHRLYRVRDGAGRALALKTLHESRAADAEERAMLAHESWLAAHATQRERAGLVATVEPREPTAFYTLYEWHEGHTLAQLLDAGRRFSVQEVLDASIVLARALGRLHRMGVIHRDIKPDNLHLGEDGQWRILDLGVALSGNEPPSARDLHAGTPSYMNPEQWGDDADTNRADAMSDLYALGATIYRWLTGKLPYGEVEPYQVGRFRRDPPPPSRLRPEVPIWLDHLLVKAVALDRRHRFETAEEMVLALERGASRPLPAAGSTPLLGRDPTAPWKIAFAISLILNLLLIYWLLFLPQTGG